MKGIILAAGKGTRLYPITQSTCKPLLPVYDKPMIYYPLALLLEAAITEILIIVPPDELGSFERLLGNGERFGAQISYVVQHDRRGIADAFIIGEEFLDGEGVCLALGDNVFFGSGMAASLEKAKNSLSGATVFGCYMDDPRPFGVAEFDSDGRVLSIEEKPKKPKSNYIVPGLYFYDNRVTDIAKTINPSARGELEITSVNNVYLQMDELRVVKLPKDVVWFDTGSSRTLLDAACAIRRYCDETGEQLGVLEETAYRRGFIDRDQLCAVARELSASDYGQYLLKLAGEA
ncbi:MAG: glucose-1-phosphate thymidylyltransferase RfbA [Oscillospiraceae bacterium]|jgi:glucose-1-phosphate thymidylyltransferase|nr:glucose-1-phosphate thymidylyltransferase RfbA [Oscillospiraceae bacterium]